jgi:type III restriction enzyme
MPLYEILTEKVQAWRLSGYPSPEYPAISEIFDYTWLTPHTQPRFLRLAQIQALETYWYLRLIEKTPHILDLYARLYSKKSERLAALGMEHPDLRELAIDFDFKDILAKVRSDDAFVKKYHLEALRETLDLDYPSYILALAMGAGKTMLIGSIIAAEFAMALEYPDAPFIQNALVFAPGLTILDALRELAEIRYDQLLPPRLYKQFAIHYKLTFTRDGEKDLPIIRRSRYNLVVTNTEKIRIQKQTVRQRKGWTQLKLGELEKQEEEIANLRLQAIASLPNLGVFSDEAHHTYGQAMERDLKRVRQTVNYLHENTGLICVVNTTGTPYYKRQLLKDVVVWYSLSEGIRDDILKDLSGSIYAYSFENSNTEAFASDVVRDFFTTYGDVRLPDGSPARLAMYFPQEKDLRLMRPVIERTLISLGLSPETILKNTSKSTQAELDAFKNLNNPNAPHRLILLVNKGTEGWNCPSLFATALARKLKSSNNFVLQAATRCLRQIPGNPHKARIYLSQDNYSTLDAQLQETYGEQLSDLDHAQPRSRQVRLVVRKTAIPRLLVRRLSTTIVPADDELKTSLKLELPASEDRASLMRDRFTLSDHQDGVLQFMDRQEIREIDSEMDLYTAATHLAAVYRLDVSQIYRQLRRLYAPEQLLPTAHLTSLARQIEFQTLRYQIHTETVEDALALLRLDGFEPEPGPHGDVIYTTLISVPLDRLDLLTRLPDSQMKSPLQFGFHYDPYNFDSDAESNFFAWLLGPLHADPDEIQDIYFTGGLTAGVQSDFYIEYQGLDGRSHRYVPDFLLRKKDGRCLVVEIKDARWQPSVHEDLHRAASGQDGLTVEGRKVVALDRWTGLDPDRLAYQVIFVADDSIPVNDLDRVQAFMYQPPAENGAS